MEGDWIPAFAGNADLAIRFHWCIYDAPYEYLHPLIPAQAGIQGYTHRNKPLWIPTFVGMSGPEGRVLLRVQ